MAVISPLLDLSVLVFIAFIVLKVLGNFIKNIQIKRNYPECQNPTFQTHRYPLGIDRIQEILQGAKDFTLARTLQKYHEEHQWTFLHSALGNSGVSTSEPENVQAILATKFKDYELGHRNKIFFPLLGDGIFTTDGSRWEHSRALMRPQFARGQVSDLDMVEKHVQDLFRAVEAKTDARGEVDIQPLFFNLTIDSATEFLFGESVNSQAKEIRATTIGAESDGEKFAEAFGVSQFCLMTRFQFRDLCWLYNPKHFRDANKICHEFVDRYVDMAIANQKKPAHEKDMSKKYVFMEAIAEVTQDRKALRYQLLNILLAGRDTTASLLSWTFYYLARHKRVWKILREEIIENFGTESEPKGGKPTFEAMKQSKYLQWVLNEVLRLEPIVPWNGRKAVRDTILPTGGGPDKKSPIFIKKGMTVDYSVFVMHRRKDLWGQDADEFRPERWGEDLARKGGSGAASWKYLPFNGGPRICLGQQFALTEASYVVIRLIQHFADLNVAMGELGYGSDGKVEQDAGIRFQTLTMCVAGGVKVKMTLA